MIRIVELIECIVCLKGYAPEDIKAITGFKHTQRAICNNCALTIKSALDMLNHTEVNK